MATENIKSTQVTNADATPVDLTPAYLSKGVVRESIGLCEAASGDAGSTYRAVRVWSGWRPSAVYLATDDMGSTGGTANIGLYDIAANGGADVDQDLFGSAVDVVTAAVSETNVLHESGVVNIDDSEKRIFEMLGLTEDPKKWYDLVVTSAGAAFAGTIKVRFQFVDGT